MTQYEHARLPGDLWGHPYRLCAALQELMNLEDNQQARLARLEAQVGLVEGQLASLQVGKFAMPWAQVSLLLRGCGCLRLPTWGWVALQLLYAGLAPPHPLFMWGTESRAGGHAAVEKVLQSAAASSAAVWSLVLPAGHCSTGL